MVENLSFKPITKEDLPFLNMVRNKYALEYLHDSRTFTLEETIHWFTQTSPDYWVIFDNDAKIGYFRLSNYSKENQNIYIGADIALEYRGKGFAKIAYKLFIPFLFETYHLNKISLEVLSTNTVAKNLYTKLGFIEEGIKRQEILKNNIFIDSVMMSLLKKEFNGYILENK